MPVAVAGNGGQFFPINPPQRFAVYSEIWSIGEGVEAKKETFSERQSVWRSFVFCFPIFPILTLLCQKTNITANRCVGFDGKN
jgi:hypothetical protein